MFSTMHKPTVESELPLRSWLQHYDRRTIITPLDVTAVRAQLTAYLDQMHARPLPSLYSYDIHYEGTLVGDTLTLSGPIGQRNVRLDTCGVIHIAPGGTAIKLTLQLCRTHKLILLGELAFVWIMGLIIGLPLVMLLLASGLGYIMSVLAFRSSVAHAVRQLLSAVGPQRAGEQGAIVPDGIGWRCGVCGGYVREDATFCKHCKQPFNA